MEKVRRVSKTVVDAGAKQMLKTDIMFLDREINNRKQKFGIEIYDLMEELEAAETMTDKEKESKIRKNFDNTRKEIAVVQAKKECKREEMALLTRVSEIGDASSSSSAIPPSSGAVLNNSHPQDSATDNM